MCPATERIVFLLNKGGFLRKLTPDVKESHLTWVNQFQWPSSALSMLARQPGEDKSASSKLTQEIAILSRMN